MRFYEYEAKALFRRHGLPLGQSRIVANGQEAATPFPSWVEVRSY